MMRTDASDASTDNEAGSIISKQQDDILRERKGNAIVFHGEWRNNNKGNFI